jgi:hypothetical protein
MATTNRRHTFTIVRNIYRQTQRPNGEIKYTTVKRNVRLEVDFYINDIVGVGELVDSKGKVHKNKCEIFHRDKGEFTVLGSKNEISDLVFGITGDSSEIGFKNK